MSTINLIADAAHFQKEPLWPLRMLRAATFRDAPFTTATLSNVVLKLENYSGEMRRRGLSIDVFTRADEALNAGTAPAALKQLITSIYDEGVAMAKVLGSDIAKVKLTNADAATLDRELKTFKSVDNLVGFYHIREFFTAAQRQAQLSLLHEEGLISTEKFEGAMAAITTSLKRGGHYGVHHAIDAHPELKEAILKDVRPIVVDFAKGKKTAGVASISNYSRAAYIQSEMAHASSLGGYGAEYVQSSLHRAMGADYMEAHGKKWQQAHELTARYSSLAKDIEVPNATLKSAMQSAATAGPQRMIDARRAFIGKHGLALLDPRTVELLHSSGNYDERFWQSLDDGMHNVMGGETPFAGHVRARAEGRAAYERASAPGSEATAIEHHDGGNTEKKTARRGQTGSEPVPGESKTVATTRHTAGTTSPTASAAEGAGAKYTAGRWASSGVFGLMLLDGINNLRQSRRIDGDAPETQNSVSFARVLEVSLGAVGLAASWLVKDSTIAKTMSRH